MKEAILELIVVPVPNRYNRKQNFVIAHKIMKNNDLKRCLQALEQFVLQE